MYHASKDVQRVPEGREKSARKENVVVLLGMDDCITAGLQTLYSRLTDVFGFVSGPGSRTGPGPTQHLFTKRLHGYEMFQRNRASVIYKIATVPGGFLCLEVHQHSLSLTFLQSNGHAINLNNVGFSWHPLRNMYILGVKMNCKSSSSSSSMTGESAVRAIMKIAQIMKIRQLFVSDASTVRCAYDPSIEIEHYSLLRLISGSPAYYERFGGHYVKPDEVAKSIALVIARLEPSEIAACKEYMTLVRTGLGSGTGTGPCLNGILQKAVGILKEAGGRPHEEYIIDIF